MVRDNKIARITVRVVVAVAAIVCCFASNAGAQMTASLINPADGATNVDLTQPFTWTSVPDVQAYYLYVGTTQGAKDLVNTGEIQQTSYRVPLTLATGATMFARLWTKMGGIWRYVDTTFVAPPVARFTYPAVTTTIVDQGQPLTWTAVPSVQAYYLYIGSTIGAKDLVNTGEMLQTSYLVKSILPDSRTLYARLWTKTGGVWRYIDRTFSVTPVVAHFTYLGNTIDLAQPLTWTTVPGAQAYYLYVGSTLGAKDLVNTGETLQTSYYIRSTRPSNQTLFARLWTKVAGVWRYVDAAFTTSFATPLRFTFPAAGVTAADLSQPFQWDPVDNAQAYYLYVGTALGQKDLVNTGEIQATSYRAASLPLNGRLYARLWVKVANAWTYIDRFITAVSSAPTAIGFDGLTLNGAAVTTYTESGFNVVASGGWVAGSFYGNPRPFIQFSTPGGSTATGEVRISADGATFSFDSVDLYSSTTQIPFTITGLRNGSTVFTFAGTLPNTYGGFITVASPNTAAVVDTLSIVLTNKTGPCCTNPMGLDTIVVAK
jgi:hypothetical protein